MAGYVFAVSKESWNDFCSENLKHGHFSPYTPQITEELQNNNRSRKSLNKVISAVFGDMITMKPGDNVYFFQIEKYTALANSYVSEMIVNMITI